LFERPNYPRFLELSQQCDLQIKLQIENKTKNIPSDLGQSSNIITNVDVNNNNNTEDVNDGDNRSSNPSDFVTSSSFVPSTPLNVVTSTNVVSSTTPSFVPPEIEITIPPHAFSPSIQSEDIPDFLPHSPLSDDDAAAMYDDFIRGAQAPAQQGNKKV
jgi:hypothetical protein